MGKVEEKDAAGSVIAIMKIPFMSFCFAFSAMALIHDAGSLKANAPRNEIPSIRKMRKKKTLNTQCSVNLFTPVTLMMPETNSPRAVKITANAAAYCSVLESRPLAVFTFLVRYPVVKG